LLLLFDIDGTLLANASAVHSQALYQALGEVYEIPKPERVKIDAAGRTDLEIARLILLRCDVSAKRIDDRLEQFQDACCAQFSRLCPPSLAEHVIAGVGQLLADLHEQPDVLLSLVTGNLEPIGRLKLARAGLGRYFPAGQGGFGSDSEDRTDLPPIARRRAGHAGVGAQPDGRPYPRERTIVIGDTPRDIACAHSDGLRCVAVATGPYPAHELGQADALASDADELNSILAQLRTSFL
jgi:phosphoglycolate phosphatase